MRAIPLEEAFWKYLSDRVKEIGVDEVARQLDQSVSSVRHYLNGTRRVQWDVVSVLMRCEGRGTATEILTRLHKAAGEVEREEVKPTERVRATARGELQRRPLESGPTDEPEIPPPSSAAPRSAEGERPRAARRGRKAIPRR